MFIVEYRTKQTSFVDVTLTWLEPARNNNGTKRSRHFRLERLQYQVFNRTTFLTSATTLSVTQRRRISDRSI